MRQASPRHVPFSSFQGVEAASFERLLPDGMAEQLEVNQRRWDRVRRIARLAEVKVVGLSRVQTAELYEEPDEYDGVDREELPLAEAKVTFPYLPGRKGRTLFGDPTAHVEVNQTEILKQISERRLEIIGPDQEIRAKFLDRALKQGLGEALYSANKDDLKVDLGLLAYLATALGLGVSGAAWGLYPTAAGVAWGGPLLAHYGISHLAASRHARSAEQFKEMLDERRMSLIAGPSYDRIWAARAALHSGRLIRAKKLQD